MKDTVQACFYYPETRESLRVELPRSTRFSQLTQLLYDRKFLPFQKGGYHYLIHDNHCGMGHVLGDYLPENAEQVDIQVFDLPFILL